MIDQPILFLDFDGVLNSTSHLLSAAKVPGGYVDTDEGQVDPAAVAQLSRVVAATGCEVVVTSTWRLLHDTTYLWNLLRGHGYTGGPFLGATPDLYGMTRAQEIDHWRWENGRPKVYAIVDDDLDADDKTGRFVKTDFDDGLTAEKADELIGVLIGGGRYHLLGRSLAQDGERVRELVGVIPYEMPCRRLQSLDQRATRAGARVPDAVFDTDLWPAEEGGERLDQQHGPLVVVDWQHDLVDQRLLGSDARVYDIPGRRRLREG